MEPETLDRRGVRQQVLAGLVLVAVGIAVWLLWPRVPLDGPTEYDFGTVSFETAPKYVEHTFALVNDSSEPIQVQRASSSCGCTEAVVPGEVIGPGQTLELPVRLRLTHSGLKEAVVTVSFYDGGSIDLGIRATGKLVHSLRAIPSRVRLRPPHGRGNTRLWMESDTEPPAPTISSHELLNVNFERWRQTGQHNADTSTPASWTGEVSMQASGEGPPRGTEIEFALPDGESVRVLVNPRLIMAPPTNADPPGASEPVAGPGPA